jgi:hypothetical protein
VQQAKDEPTNDPQKTSNLAINDSKSMSLVPNSSSVPRAVVAYDEKVIKSTVAPWVEMSRQLGGPVDEQVSNLHPSPNILRRRTEFDRSLIKRPNCLVPSSPDCGMFYLLLHTAPKASTINYTRRNM